MKWQVRVFTAIIVPQLLHLVQGATLSIDVSVTERPSSLVYECQTMKSDV